MKRVKRQLLYLVRVSSVRSAQASTTQPCRKMEAEYSTAEEDAQADAWNAALDAVQELNR